MMMPENDWHEIPGIRTAAPERMTKSFDYFMKLDGSPLCFSRRCMEEDLSLSFAKCSYSLDIGSDRELLAIKVVRTIIGENETKVVELFLVSIK